MSAPSVVRDKYGEAQAGSSAGSTGPDAAGAKAPRPARRHARERAAVALRIHFPVFRDSGCQGAPVRSPFALAVAGVRVPPIIVIDNVSKTYASGFEALKSVNLEIRRGEIFALLGP